MAYVIILYPQYLQLQMQSPPRHNHNRELSATANTPYPSTNYPRSNYNKLTENKMITINRQNINRAIQIFGWRFKTSLPILKPVHCCLNPNFEYGPKWQSKVSDYQISKTQNNVSQSKCDTSAMIKFVRDNPHLQYYQLLVRIENIKYRLNELNLLPFSQIIYLLKEMMIGYDVLIDIFGYFDPTDQMVVVNGNDQWRVWIHQNNTTFNKEPNSAVAGEKQFIYRLILIAEKHCVVGPLSKIFFNELKECTYSNECSFIKILQRIKDFTTSNKIFGVNKVTVPSERIKGSQFFKEHSKKISLSEMNKMPKSYKMNQSNFIEKRMVTAQSSLAVSQISRMLNSQSKEVNINTNQVRKQSLLGQTTIQQKTNIGFVQSKQINTPINGATNGHLVNDKAHPLIYFSQILKPQPVLVDNNKKRGNIGLSPNMTPKQSHNSSFSHYNDNSKISITKQDETNCIIPPLLNLSPPRQNKSRHQIKRMMNSKPSPHNTKKQSDFKTNIKDRKYSQQLLKAKSLDMLMNKSKVNHDTNKEHQQKVILFSGEDINKTEQKPDNSPNSLIISPNKLDSSQHKSISPNNSSSTKALQNSGETQKIKQDINYQNLKDNDLNTNKFRNNQSSYYGMYGLGDSHREEKPKNLTLSYDFRNGNQFRSRSPSQDNQPGGNWTKRLSGLFSDDASIKHLKASVQIKTKEEQLFQKEYLKDVKLEMLQKFGRPVRHSIVDEEDQFAGEGRPINKIDQYKSMQQIEEVIDEDKSCLPKDQCLQQQQPVRVRARNQTMFIGSFKKPIQDELSSKQPEQKKQCLSEHYSSQNSQVEAYKGYNH